MRTDWTSQGTLIDEMGRPSARDGTAPGLFDVCVEDRARMSDFPGHQGDSRSTFCHSPVSPHSWRLDTVSHAALSPFVVSSALTKDTMREQSLHKFKREEAGCSWHSHRLPARKIDEADTQSGRAISEGLPNASHGSRRAELSVCWRDRGAASLRPALNREPSHFAGEEAPSFCCSAPDSSGCSSGEELPGGAFPLSPCSPPLGSCCALGSGFVISISSIANTHNFRTRRIRRARLSTVPRDLAADALML
jgi:hypothetical protein